MALQPDGEIGKVTFADLVFAHHLRQVERYRTAQGQKNGRPFDAEIEQLYADRLAAFEAANGKIIQAYWCTYEISGLALTEEKIKQPWWRGRRTETRITLHGETDWALRDSPELANQIHKIDNLAVRADEILRETGERIAMQLLMAAMRHVLSYVDRAGGAPTRPDDIRKIVKQSDAEIAEARKYYDQAAGNASRIVYAGGMLYGAAFLALVTVAAGLIFWAAGAFDKPIAWTLIACASAGGVGSAISVLLRMRSGNFTQDYEVGRKIVRRLAVGRPFIGASFAVVLFLGLKSGLVDLGGLSPATRTIYFYSVIGFLAGFSERWARVIVTGALGAEEPDERKKEEKEEQPSLVVPEGARVKQTTTQTEFETTQVPAAH
jgi:hypothetical protein